MRKLFSILILTFLISPALHADPIAIGYIGGLTADGISSEAEQSLRAIQLAIKQQNLKGGLLGRLIQLEIFDTKGDPTLAQELIKDVQKKHIEAVVGFHSSNDALAIVPKLDRLKIPVVVASATSPKILDNKKYVVQTCLNDESMARSLAEKLYSMGKRRVIIATDVTETFTVGLSIYFQKYFENLGGLIALTEDVDIDNISFSSLAKRIKNCSEKADVLFISARALESVYLWLALQDVHFKLDVIGSDGFQSQNMDILINKFRTHFNLTLFPSHWDPFSTGSKTVHFFKDFKKEFPLYPLSDHEIDPFLSYDSAIILFQAIQKTQSLEPDLLIKNLKATTATGVSGAIGFDQNGSSNKKPFFLRFQKGALKLAE